MSLEQAIQDQTKALQSIATSLAVLVAKGALSPSAEAPAAEAKPAKAEEKPKTEAKSKAEPKPKAEKPLAEKTEKDLIQEVIEESEAEAPTAEDDDDDDLYGLVEDEPAAEEPKDGIKVPPLPAGERNVKYAIEHMVTPVFSSFTKPEFAEILAQFGAAKLTEIPPEKWDEVYAVGYRLMKSKGKK